MSQRRRDLILHKRVRRIADEHDCSVAEVNSALDQHPIEVNRDQYLKRTLALELLHLDELEDAFRDKAIEDRDVASGTLLVKIAERRSALLGPVAVVQPPPAHQPTSTDRIEAVLKQLREIDRAGNDPSTTDSDGSTN